MLIINSQVGTAEYAHVVQDVDDAVGMGLDGRQLPLACDFILLLSKLTRYII